jgi:hypothetical protein
MEMEKQKVILIKDPKTNRSFYYEILSKKLYPEKPENSIIIEKDPNEEEWWELYDQKQNMVILFSNKVLFL